MLLRDSFNAGSVVTGALNVFSSHFRSTKPFPVQISSFIDMNHAALVDNKFVCFTHLVTLLDFMESFDLNEALK